MSKEKISFETFRQIGSYAIAELTFKNPSCFNSNVNVEKYRVTVELIEESKEVYAERLQKLWEESKNHYDYDPLVSMAKKHGIELLGERGSKNKK